MEYTDLRDYIREIPDFPEKGILFRDITPLLLSPQHLRISVERLSQPFKDESIDLVLGVESRGFIFGPAVALQLSTGFGLIRKEGKLPFKTRAASYDLEYGTDKMEMHVDTVKPDQRVLIVDDLIATGGTCSASMKLVKSAGGTVVGCTFLIELVSLGGRERIKGPMFNSVIEYP